jgi:lipoate-protein ligase A
LKKLKIFISNSTNIFQNLALEEYLVTQAIDDILLFYLNNDAVVLGKHQNPWLEVNINLATNNNISIARRLSGGGTVFHDLGNINFSFIRNKDADFVNFKEHIEPISNALKALGIENSISPRNDIFIGDFKVSGNAEHVNNTSKRIIHHGTLLYDANISKLSANTKPIPLNIKTHAVASVRSKVLNIKEVKDYGTANDFLQLLITEVEQCLDIYDKEIISPETMEGVEHLLTTKYTKWEWNFGHTPQFEYTDTENLMYKIRKGFVIECNDESKLNLRCDKIIK